MWILFVHNSWNVKWSVNKQNIVCAVNIFQFLLLKVKLGQFSIFKTFYELSSSSFHSIILQLFVFFHSVFNFLPLKNVIATVSEQIEWARDEKWTKTLKKIIQQENGYFSFISLFCYVVLIFDLLFLPLPDLGLSDSTLVTSLHKKQQDLVSFETS